MKAKIGKLELEVKSFKAQQESDDNKVKTEKKVNVLLGISNNNHLTGATRKICKKKTNE